MDANQTVRNLPGKLAACFAQADELMKSAPRGPIARDHLTKGAQSAQKAMSAIVVDASVSVAAQDPVDPFCTRCRAFLSHTVATGIVVHVPAFARVEVACALARKLRDSVSAEHLANLLFQRSGAREHPFAFPL